jgi:hypothetical protein
MRKATIIGIAVVLAALIAAAVAAATLSFSGSSHATPTTARVLPSGHAALEAGGNPLRVTGTGFKPGEHVRVTVLGGRKQTKNVVASSRGTFSVKFQGRSDCASLTVYALGDRGSRTSFNLSSFLCR